MPATITVALEGNVTLQRSEQMLADITRDSGHLSKVRFNSVVGRKLVTVAVFKKPLKALTSFNTKKRTLAKSGALFPPLPGFEFRGRKSFGISMRECL